MKYGGWLFLLALITLGSCNQGDEDNEPDEWEFTTPEHFGTTPESPENNPITEHGVALGRELFYETLLSSDSSISCGSCHKQELGFGDDKQFSNGVGGTTLSRHTPSLSNMLWRNFFFWDGRATSLEDQARGPIENPDEMNLEMEEAVIRLRATENYADLFSKAFGDTGITEDRILMAIAQFERTLVSGNSRFDRYKLGEIELTEQELRGEQLFNTHPIANNDERGANCADCHVALMQTDDLFHNIGLDENNEDDLGLGGITFNPNDFGKFKTPSLRNVAISGPYMHDGRFETLEEVLEHYNEHVQQNANLDPLMFATNNPSNGEAFQDLGLTEQEIEDVIAFLHTLTDDDYLTEPDFSDPNK